MAKIEIGGLVEVMTGGKQGRGGYRVEEGRVLKDSKETNKVIVEGVNMVKKHNRIGQSERGGKTGGIESQEAPIHISNVALVDPSTKKPSKVGFKITTSKEGVTTKVRIAKKSGKEF